ncbi:hypothetical protein KGF56_001621 [Candida oxycetoniae]|uniref:STB6-like N-terminal domain-containing protein n=1 Tax=Candida oxycetoniae TaxID=497107 RepID=A0AAI9WYX6_9ASCO|nr:uncharacterized protein KGF56_001621 [Candida oxycetoniae]KAI3405603.2 hypothetical protein KGF56_001621 [Candida oxycetoniae]
MNSVYASAPRESSVVGVKHHEKGGPPSSSLTTTNPHFNSNSNSISNSSSGTSRFVNGNDFITYIIPDFNAVKYFQKDFVTSNEFYIIEESEVNGFELYLVEQWVINRNIATVVTTYTGNEQSKISVVRFTIIKKPTKYYPIRFQEYLNEIVLNHSKMKTVDKADKEKADKEKLGTEKPGTESRSDSANELLTISKLSTESSTLAPTVKKNKSSSDYVNEVCFVTNLASLPSNLNLIPVPHGDTRKLEAPFIINYDLKKLQCTGRSASLATDRISDANEAKFRQVYKIYNIKVPIKFAVRELVNLIQTCLFYFDLLDGRYCTGLLCVKTEEAIVNWWNLIGLPHFNTKPDPRNGILPSQTVAAIISLILSIRLRLLIVGVSDTPKDPFDFETFMLAIGLFQRQNKMDKTRKLDMETLNKLFTITNSKLMPEKGSNYFYNSTFVPGEAGTHHEYDLMTSSSSSSPQQNFGYSSSSHFSPGAGATSKRLYGKKELKKMANVMKTTVQDHINAASTRDSDEMQMPKKPSGGRIRSKIAKLADNVSPLDVENLDLEVLVKHYLVGKTLIRLFWGAQTNNALIMNDDGGGLSGGGGGLGGGGLGSSSSSGGDPNGRLRVSEISHHRRGGKQLDESPSPLYAFESLRDKIISNHNIQLSGDNSKYSLGLSRRFGLPSSKKSMSDGKPASFSSSSHLEVNGGPDNYRSLNTSSVVDSFLQLANDNSSCAESECSITKKPFDANSAQNLLKVNHPLFQFKRNLNRRNSWPFVLNKYEENLNTLVQFKDKNAVNPELVQYCVTRPRSASTSLLQNKLLSSSDVSVATMAKFSQKYLDNIDSLMKYENLRNHYFYGTSDNEQVISNVQLGKSFCSLNVDLMKLKNLKNQMNANKVRIMEEGVVEHLQYNLRTLFSTVDRLNYETRIVTKKMNELEENFKVFELKLKDGCQNKMNKMINLLLVSKDFKEVYPDLSERKKIAFQLTGDETYSRFNEEAETMSFIRHVVVFFYDILVAILQWFKFERTHMNLERIRESWIQLDPSKSLIKKTYTYLGREPSSDSIASVE